MVENEARSAKNAETRAWVILRSQTTTQVYRGILADSYETAEAAFLRGEGVLCPNETRYGPWELDGEPV